MIRDGLRMTPTTAALLLGFVTLVTYALIGSLCNWQRNGGQATVDNFHGMLWLWRRRGIPTSPIASNPLEAQQLELAAISIV